MVNAASTLNPSVIVDIDEAYPYPSHVIAPNFVTMKLSGDYTFNVWETQILCLLKSHHMFGFVEGQFQNPAGNGKGKEGDIDAWIASDSLVKGWILGSLSDGVAQKVVDRLKPRHKNTDFTAKDLWDELQCNYGPWVREQAAAASTLNPSFIVEVEEAYPYPSHVNVSNFVTVELGGDDTYNEWETQIISLLKNHQMIGFINGQFPSPAGNEKGEEKDIDTWTRSDSLVKHWILGSLSEEASRKVVNHLTDKQKKTEFTAKDLWDELQRSYSPSASTWNPRTIVEVGKAYPYPSHVSAPSFVTVKLSGKNKYNLWERQMLCLLKSHQMYGFINGQYPHPTRNEEGKMGDIEAWTISDSLVKGWILGSLSEEAARHVVNHLSHNLKETDFTAKDLWDKLQWSYGPQVHEQAETKLMTTQAESANTRKKSTDFRTIDLYKFVLEGNTDVVMDRLKGKGLNPWDELMNNGNTILHVAVGPSTKNLELLETLLEMTLKENTISLLDITNSNGSTLLHVAAIGGNTAAVNILVKRDPGLLLVKDNEGHTPLEISVSNMHTKTSESLFQNMQVYGYGALFSGQSWEELVVLAISCQDFSLARRIIDNYPEAILLDSDVLTTLAQNFPRELNFWERRVEFMQEVRDRTKPYEPMVSRVKEYFNQSLVLPMLLLFFISGFFAIVTGFGLFLKAIVHPFVKDTSQFYDDAKSLLWEVCSKTVPSLGLRRPCAKLQIEAPNIISTIL